MAFSEGRCVSNTTAFLRENQVFNQSDISFDLTGVILVPSGIVGLLVSLVHRDIKVAVFNASPEIREVFTVTQVNRMVTLHDVEATEQSGND